MDLTEFLNARLDEDEAAAKAADGGAWVWSGPFEVADIFGGTADMEEIGSHIARHDPARVLREVAAKRAILAQWEAMPPESPVLTFALSALAAVYSDHPDYRDEWTF